MKYLVLNSESTLGTRTIGWLKNLNKQAEVTLGVDSVKDKNKISKLSNKTEIKVISKDLIKNSNVVVYLTNRTLTLKKQIEKFEAILKAVDKNSSLIFVTSFADQENSPFIMSPFSAYAIRRLAGLQIKYSVIKYAVFADQLVHELPEIIKNKFIPYPVGSKPVSFITLNDCAHAIASLVGEQTLRDCGQTYLLSMEENYNMVEVAYVISRATEEKITYQPQVDKPYNTSYLSTLYQAGKMGLLQKTSNDFHRLTGREAENLEHFLRNEYQISKLNALNIQKD